MLFMFVGCDGLLVVKVCWLSRFVGYQDEAWYDWVLVYCVQYT
jgi:hypothetical protein